MRISSLIVAALMAALMTATSCGGGDGQPASDNAAGPGVDYASWQPQQSMDRVTDLDTALRHSAWVASSGVELTVLDSFNRPDASTLSTLNLERRGDRLVITSDSSLSSAMIYLRTDGTREHVADVGFDGSGTIGVSVAVDGRTHAIGVTATGGRLLEAGSPLASVTLADGPSTVQRRTMAIDAPNNRVGIVDQQKLIAQDNGEAIATLSWRERLTGDYDINGVVTIADITPVGQQFGNGYDTEDPDASPKVEVVDGDLNGLITLADITPIGQNFNTQLIGYDVYRTELADPSEDPTDDVTDARWSKVENASDPGLPSAPRSEVPNNGVRLTYTFVDNTIPDTGGDFAWAVVPRAGEGQTPSEGPVSNIAKSLVSPKGAPVDLVIEDPATGSLTVGDEFWVAVRITDVIGLFSANMRFEYDSSLLEVVDVEGVDQILPEYTDGEFSGTNMLTDPLFIGIDNVAPADSPYVLLGFNDTQKQGTPVVDGSGAVGFIKFRAIAEGSNAEAIRWPQSSTYILLWGEEFGVPAVNPILGPPLDIVISPAS